MKSLLLVLLAVFASAASTTEKDVAAFAEKRRAYAKKKSATMVEQHRLLRERYEFTGTALDYVQMSGGKAVQAGPVAKDFNKAYRPLPHPSKEGHLIFPNFYVQVHPELERVDADFDLPDAYLPEYPPPLYLSSRPDLGDVSKGMEINQENFDQLLDGALTAEQLEGVRLMLLPRKTLFFNDSEHRLTEKPARGVSCFSCHVNGHTNGGALREPSTRPRASAPRSDTPSLRGVADMKVFGTKRKIATLEKFVEVEDYFDEEPELAKHIGALELSPKDIKAMAAFMRVVGFPPNEKLEKTGRLSAKKAGADELAGEKLFHGKARCVSCHPGADFSDQGLHDLRADRAFGGPREGEFKTPTLRAIKDSPPYLHDGRLPTLEDAVEFFDRLDKLGLTADEKKHLTAYLRAL